MVKASPRKTLGVSSDFHANDYKKESPFPKGSSQKSEELEIPPSEHLWIYNVSARLTEDDLAEQFSRYGEIERLILQSSKNLASVSFRTVEDAVYAKRGLHGETLGGSAIQVEFAKGDLESERPRDGNLNIEKPKSNKDGDPSEVLWIGFPLHMKMDEKKLRKVFEPFGGVEKITTFPGRTYAFVKFESIKAACRAKDGVHQGKAFDDPRVNVTFAKSEVGPVQNSRGGTITSSAVPPSPVKVDIEPSNLLSEGEMLGIDRTGDSSKPEVFSFVSPVIRLDESDVSSKLDSGVPQMPHKDLEEDSTRMKRGGTECDLKMELPNTGGSAGQQSAQEEPPVLKRMRTVEGDLSNDLAQSRVIDSKSSLPLSSHKNISRLENNNQEPNAALSLTEASRYHESSTRYHESLTSDLQGSNLLSSNDTTGLGQRMELFRWEGTLAKSGNLVCHARCLPARTNIDVTFPEVLDCKARTSLDMLANHIINVSDFSVVLFMPQEEIDVAPYQEFMGYLSEKQRVAVCKVSDDSTLFLVPPLDFVENFLKVPRSKNIFGVIIKTHALQQSMAGKTGPFSFLESQTPMAVDDFGEKGYLNMAKHEDSKFMGGTIGFSMAPSTVTFPSFTSIGFNFPPNPPPAAPLVESMFGATKPLGLLDGAKHTYKSQDSLSGKQEPFRSYVNNGPIPPPLTEMHSNKGIHAHLPLVLPHVQMSSMDQHPGCMPSSHGPNMMKSSILGAPPYPAVAHFNPPPLPPHLQQALFHEPQPPSEDTPSKDTAYDHYGLSKRQAPSTAALEASSSLSMLGAFEQSEKVAAESKLVDQEKLLGEILAAKSESDEDNKKFKATLELAAALLQQLRQQTKS